MRYLIRKTAVVSFIFLLLAGASCSRQSANEVSKQPLATPQVVANRPKIIAFGDSLTAGFGLSEKESYPYLLQDKVKADGYDFEVINAGVSGDTSLGGLERADWVFEQDNAKIVILELGANDLLRGIPVAQMKKNLDQIIRKAKAKNLKILLCGMLAPPSMGSDYQQQFTVALGDVIENSAAIYFDFNVPVLTNTALTEIISPTSVSDFSNRSDQLTVFPNPATKPFYLKLPSGVNSSKLKMISTNGEAVFTKSFENTYTPQGSVAVKLPVLSQGIYFVSLITAEGKIFNSKIVIKN